MRKRNLSPGLHSPWAYYTSNISPTVVPRDGIEHKKTWCAVFISCRLPYMGKKKKKPSGLIFSNSLWFFFFYLYSAERWSFLLMTERSPCCQNPWNMLCSVPDFCCILSLRTDGSGIIYQTEKTGCFRPHRAAIHFQRGPPVLQTLISLPRDLRCRQVRGTRSRISHIHCIPDPFAQYLGAPPGATVDPSGLRRQADVGKKEWGACREVKRAQCIRSATPLVLYTDSCAL